MDTSIIKFSDLQKYCESQQYIDSCNFVTDFQGFNSFESMKQAFKKFEFAGVAAGNQTCFETSLNLCGFAPNVPAYLNNEPENMYFFDHSEDIRLIEINIYISMPWTVPASDILKNGQILKTYLENNTTTKDRFKVNFLTGAKAVFMLGSPRTKKKTLTPQQPLRTKIELCNFDDYLTPELLTMICSPAFYRHYVLSSYNLLTNYKTRRVNTTPVAFNSLETSEQETFLNFMDMANELKKIKFN